MIKFRAWDNECKIIRDYDELKGLTLDALDASDFKLEQFTGLKDVNGNDIYEGDILKATSRYLGIKNEIVLVEECIPYIQTTKAPYDEQLYDYRIIGNVHENAELLKG